MYFTELRVLSSKTMSKVRRRGGKFVAVMGKHMDSRMCWRQAVTEVAETVSDSRAEQEHPS